MITSGLYQIQSSELRHLVMRLLSTRFCSTMTGYINKIATRTFYDEYGNAYLGIDEDMKQMIQTKLISRIVAFDPDANAHSK